MNQTSIAAYLSGRQYPGRCVLMGQSADGSRAVMAYFIMGRSENSRNRVFLPDGDGLRIEAFDPSKLSDPSLVIYAPVRVLGGRSIVTNGDQTDTVRDFLSRGESFEAALRTRCFEPDAPHHTPRISGLMEADGRYRLSILKCGDADGKTSQRFFFEYDPLPGTGHLIHTYQDDGSPLPSFAGEPVAVGLPDDIDALASAIWQHLRPEYKVALFVRYLPLAGGSAETRIINIHEQEGLQ